MRRIAAKGDEGAIRLIFDDDLDRCKPGCPGPDCEGTPARFIGYEIGGSLYSSLETVPAWARPRAAALLIDDDHYYTAIASADVDEDLSRAIALKLGGRGRPRQTACSRGHSLRSARVGRDGRRHCRRCEALVRTNARKGAGQSTRFEPEIEGVV